MYYPSSDVLGVSEFQRALVEFQPDIVYMTADAGTATALSMHLPSMPSLSYIPIEGEPLGNRDWRGLISSLPVFTCSQYGVDIIKRDTGRDVPYYYHGVGESFRKLENRDEIRDRLSWEDKFVIMAVSTNVRRKQLPRLIEAVSILRNKYKQNDILLYLHTVPFQQYWLDGHNLREVTDFYDVTDITIYNALMEKRNDSIPEEDFKDDKGRWNPGLVSLYNAADLFVNPSQVEGFGMPTAEAMACGLPVLVTKYAAGWEVASPAGRGIPVHDWELHKSTTKYANIDPQALASEILRLKRNPKDRQRMSDAGIERAKDFTWDAYEGNLVRLAEDAIRAHQERSQSQQAADKSKEEANTQGVGVRRDEGQDTSTTSPSLIKRNVEDIERQEKAYKIGQKA